MTGLVVAGALVLVALLVAAWRAATAAEDAERVLAADLLFFSVVGLAAVVGVLVGSAYTFDVVLLGTLVGLLGSVSLARLLTRGRR